MFESPFTAIIAGGTGTGKTKWLLKFINNRQVIIKNPPNHVLYCYSEINEDILNLKKDGIEVFNGIPTKEDIQTKPKNLLLILDDLANEIKPEFLDILYTRGSHHWNVSVILVTQNLFDKNIKVARINSHFLVLMKSPQSLLQIKTLGSQLFPGKINYFMESYYDAIEKNKFGYLIINMQPNSAPDFRLTTSIFPNENTIIYLPIS
jgi:hypothetical protein